MDEFEETFQETSTPRRNSSYKQIHRTIVPWQNAEQFIKVYEKLYSPSINDKRWAVDQITVWETRCQTSLPRAVEATVVLVGAIIQDMLLELGKTLCRERDIQTLYSMAIVRFINLVLHTENGEPRRNLTILADQHNIPQWVLDLRHDSAHAHTPPLPLLRMGVKFAIKYLEDTYWRKEASNICQVVKTPSNLDDNVSNIITKFKNVQFLLKKDSADKSGLERDRKELIENIHTLAKKNKERFVEALVKPGVFLCAKEIEQLLNTNYETLFLELEGYLTLPECLMQFWFEVIRILHSFDLISYFMEMLLHSLEHSSNVLCQKTAVSWAIQLVQETVPNAPTSILNDIFKTNVPHLHLKRLLYASMKGKHPFNSRAFTAIMDRIGEKDEHYQLYLLVSVYHGLKVGVPGQEEVANETPAATVKTAEMQENDPIVFTAQDLENDYNEERLKKLGLTNQKNIWSMAPVNMEFANLPLGAIISPAIPVQNVEEPKPVNDKVEEQFIIEEKDKEPTVEVKITPDINIFQYPEINDMMYRR